MLGDRAEPETDAGSSDDNGVVEDPNAADLRAVLEQIRLNASDKPSTCTGTPASLCSARLLNARCQQAESSGVRRGAHPTRPTGGGEGRHARSASGIIGHSRARSIMHVCVLPDAAAGSDGYHVNPAWVIAGAGELPA